MYTKKQLKTRKNILQTHTTFCSFLDANMINLLVHLFDKETTNLHIQKIDKYVEYERKKYGLTSKIDVNYKVYGLNKSHSSLHLGIVKQGEEIFHLTIHLCLENLNPKKSGIVHIKKNIWIYENI